MQYRSGSRRPVCNYYKHRGHVISECWTLEQKKNNPSGVLSHQGSNFMSSVMQQVTYQLGIKQCKSAACHPESQGHLNAS